MKKAFFVPLVFETSGYADADAMAALKSWAAEARQTSKCTPSYDHRLRPLMECIATALHHGNALLLNAFLRRFQLVVLPVGLAPVV